MKSNFQIGGTVLYIYKTENLYHLYNSSLIDGRTYKIHNLSREQNGDMWVKLVGQGTEVSDQDQAWKHSSAFICLNDNNIAEMLNEIL